jgi:hypothetical protein
MYASWTRFSIAPFPLEQQSQRKGMLAAIARLRVEAETLPGCRRLIFFWYAPAGYCEALGLWDSEAEAQNGTEALSFSFQQTLPPPAAAVSQSIWLVG